MSGIKEEKTALVLVSNLRKGAKLSSRDTIMSPSNDARLPVSRTRRLACRSG